MKYSDQQFGQELMTQLDIGYDPIRIAKWAFARYLSVTGDDASEAVYDAIESIFTMEEGPQFYFSDAELRAMAQRFMMPK